MKVSCSLLMAQLSQENSSLAFPGVLSPGQARNIEATITNTLNQSKYLQWNPIFSAQEDAQINEIQDLSMAGGAEGVLSSGRFPWISADVWSRWQGTSHSKTLVDSGGSTVFEEVARSLVWDCFLYLQMETFALFSQEQVGMYLYGKKIKLLK